MISRYYSCQDSGNWGEGLYKHARPCGTCSGTWLQSRVVYRYCMHCECVAFMMANGQGVQGDLQATRDLLARAVERLDHMGTQQQPPRERSQQVQVGRAYPYNPIPGPSQERLSLFQSHGTAAGTRFFSGTFRGGYNRRLPACAPKSKKKKIAMWQHSFVCLADVGQTRVPAPLEKAKLMQAGLGQRDVAFLEFGGSSEFHLELLEAFPKLKQAGGYELLRTSEHSNKELAVIPPPSGGYTAQYLKAVVSQAKVYVRPLQHSLSLETVSGHEDVSIRLV